MSPRQDRRGRFYSFAQQQMIRWCSLEFVYFLLLLFFNFFSSFSCCWFFREVDNKMSINILLLYREMLWNSDTHTAGRLWVTHVRKIRARDEIRERERKKNLFMFRQCPDNRNIFKILEWTSVKSVSRRRREIKLTVCVERNELMAIETDNKRRSTKGREKSSPQRVQN